MILFRGRGWGEEESLLLSSVAGAQFKRWDVMMMSVFVLCVLITGTHFASYSGELLLNKKWTLRDSGSAQWPKGLIFLQFCCFPAALRMDSICQGRGQGDPLHGSWKAEKLLCWWVDNGVWACETHTHRQKLGFCYKKSGMTSPRSVGKIRMI